MKQPHLLLTLALCASLTSCFKDEPLNAEADIEQAYVSLDNPEEVFFNVGEATIDVPSTSTEIVFRPKNNDVDLTAMAPQFKLTEGATIQPASGSVQDFSNGKSVQYTVTSQDGQYKRIYNVKFTPYYLITHDEITYSFENYKLEDSKQKYYEWTEEGADGEQEAYWATANYGFSLTAGSKGPEAYPTTVDDNGVSGKCVKLTTCSTGTLGAMFNMPIAAGNMFIGQFKLTNIAQAVKNTFFGRTFYGTVKPKTFSGWYKYKPGETMTGSTDPDAIDSADIYAILYRRHYTDNDDGTQTEVLLDGETVVDDKSIIARAQVPEVTETNGWIEFSVDFVYTEELDEELLKSQGYNIAIVASSSKNGASFIGAVGSTLYIDEFKITCEQSEANE